MTFGINKFAIMVGEPLDFNSPPNLVDSTFYLSCHPLPKASQYTCFGIPFDESLELKAIRSTLNSNINHKVNSYFGLLTKKCVHMKLKCEF